MGTIFHTYNDCYCCSACCALCQLCARQRARRARSRQEPHVVAALRCSAGAARRRPDCQLERHLLLAELSCGKCVSDQKDKNCAFCPDVAVTLTLVSKNDNTQ